AGVTLIAAATAGLLIWLATQIGHSSNGDYWASYGVIAGAGLVMAVSQLLGGWTKWGGPRISLSVLLCAFVPAAIAVLWITVSPPPRTGSGRTPIRTWSTDNGTDGFVRDFGDYVGALAFGLGLLLGYSFDTAGPASRHVRDETRATQPAEEKAPASSPETPP